MYCTVPKCRVSTISTISTISIIIINDASNHDRDDVEKKLEKENLNKNDLSIKKCEPCSGNTPKLNFEEISKYLSDLNEWTVNDKQEMIFKKFKFNNLKI